MIIDKSPWRRIIDSRGTELTMEKTGEVPVMLADQTTEVVDLSACRFISNATLEQDVALDASVLTLTVDAGFDLTSAITVTTILCLKEDFAFYQGNILSATLVTGDTYEVTLDTPLDFAFTVAGSSASVRDTNLAVDGSVTPVIFSISPALMDASVQWDITRMQMNFVGPGFGPTDPTPDDTGFGTQIAITNGMVFRQVDGKIKNIFNAKTNQDFHAHCDSLVYREANKNGNFGVSVRRFFAGQHNNGVVIRLKNDEIPAQADRFNIIVQDDLTTHERIKIVLQGHVTTRPYAETI